MTCSKTELTLSCVLTQRCHSTEFSSKTFLLESCAMTECSSAPAFLYSNLIDLLPPTDLLFLPPCLCPDFCLYSNYPLVLYARCVIINGPSAILQCCLIMARLFYWLPKHQLFLLYIILYIDHHFI